MAIKSIHVSNFKSFKDVDIELKDFTVLIGANASGKSNFVQVFKFLIDVASDGLKNAISMQGGVSYLRNMAIDRQMGTKFQITHNQSYKRSAEVKDSHTRIGISVEECTYEFALEYLGRGQGYKISKDQLSEKCSFVELEYLKGKAKEINELGSGKLVYKRIGQKLEMDLSEIPEGIKLSEEDIIHPRAKDFLCSGDILLRTMFMLSSPWEDIFRRMSIYDFDPKLPKKAIQITGRADLEEDGSNLALTLQRIIRNKNATRKFYNLVKDLMPFLHNLSMENLADKSLLFKVRESYLGKKYLPSSLLSDGTINIFCLIVALYFEDQSVAIIEEPERNIHPYLISKVVDLMREVSAKKQIIVTTHNPIIVKYAGLENILLVSRDKEGFSQIIRPGDKKEVRAFLKNDMGVDELFVQNLLEF